MPNHIELLESALDVLPEGAAIADLDGKVTLWNSAAEAITGYASSEVMGIGVREILDQLIAGGARQWIRQTDSPAAGSRGAVISARHKAGHELPLLARVLALRDGLGVHIGTEVLFHSVESMDALPRGDIDEPSNANKTQAEFEDRLTALHEDFLRGDLPLGVLWVAVDQAPALRRTHGTRACEAMLEKVERTLASGLKPTEEIGGWGDNDFLVLAHERSAAMLASHAQVLTGLARTTDFRWWGDRVSLTVSVGAAQAERGESLFALLERAQAAMLASLHLGGNHVTVTPGRQACWSS